MIVDQLYTVKVLAHWGFCTLENKYDLMSCQSCLHTASKTFVRHKKIQIRHDFLNFFCIRSKHFDRSHLSIRHPFLSKCLLRMWKCRKLNLTSIFLWRKKVSEAVCKHDWHYMRSYLFFNVWTFRTRISDSVCKDLKGAVCRIDTSGWTRYCSPNCKYWRGFFSPGPSDLMHAQDARLTTPTGTSAHDDELN